MEALKHTFKVHVFPTDIGCRAINAARADVYPASIAADMSPERIVLFLP